MVVATAQADDARGEVDAFWKKRLRAVEGVKTPDPAFDLMVNRWLLYQTTASRLMARAGYYQAGGAFGYRDQLQDVLALLTSEPERARAQNPERGGASVRRRGRTALVASAPGSRRAHTLFG